MAGNREPQRRKGNRVENHDEATHLPADWPTEVDYLTSASVPSAQLSPFHQAIFCRELPKDSPLHPRRLRESAWGRIRPIKDAAHPAYGQAGLFAIKDIPPRTVVVPYLGVVHTNEESDPESDYDLGVWAPMSESSTVKVSLGIDATTQGCEARFVNDYRGVAERPNVFFEEFHVNEPSGHGWRGLVFKTGSKTVKAGEELLVSYGKGFWAARQTSSESAQAVSTTLEEPSLRPSIASSHVQDMLARQRARLQRLKNTTAAP